MTRRSATALALLLTLLTLGMVPAAAKEAEPTPWLADFYGQTIDLRDGWGAARACTTDGVATACFLTEAEMDRHLGDEIEHPITPLANCSTSLRLYDLTSYGTPVLSISARGTWLNLSSVGFNDRTSSYRVGACAALFAKNANGGGGFYPGSTGAGAQSSTMLSGWNNAVSSVFIY